MPMTPKTNAAPSSPALAEEPGQEGDIGSCHEGFCDLVDQPASDKVAQRYGEELEHVARAVDAALEGCRNARPEQGLQVGVHDGNAHPAYEGTQAPDGRRAGEGQDEVLAAHGHEERGDDAPHAALRRGKRTRDEATGKHGDARCRLHCGEGGLTRSAQDHGRECRVVDGCDEVDRREEEDDLQETASVDEVGQPLPHHLQKATLASLLDRDMDEDQEDQEGDEEGRQVDHDDGSQATGSVERRGDGRRGQIDEAACQSIEARRLLVEPRGSQQADGLLTRRLLEALGQT